MTINVVIEIFLINKNNIFDDDSTCQRYLIGQIYYLLTKTANKNISKIRIWKLTLMNLSEI